MEAITKMFGVPFPAVILILYLIVINIVGFVSMAVDKHKSKHKKWRTPERRLMIIAIIGGSIGCLLGMDLFRHKTKHKKFRLGIPIILMAQIVVALLVLKIKFF